MPERLRSRVELEALVEVSTAIGLRNPRNLDRALRLAAKFARVSDVDEVILQTHLFVGYPLTLEAMRRWREVRTDSGTRALEEQEDWKERGEITFRKVYGSASDRLLRVVELLHPELRRWMVETGYGRVIGRPQLDLVRRELCIAALLAVWDTPRQLHSHLRGALNAGATHDEVDWMLGIAVRGLTPTRMSGVTAVWETVKGK